MQTKTIPANMQEDVIGSYWVMLREYESNADNTNDAIGKIQVEAFYRQWNEMTGDNKVPIWVTRG